MAVRAYASGTRTRVSSIKVRATAGEREKKKKKWQVGRVAKTEHAGRMALVSPAVESLGIVGPQVQLGKKA